MPNTVLHTRFGSVHPNPSDRAMQEALEQLTIVDPERHDCRLAGERGWVVAVFPSGLVQLRNEITGEGPWHMTRQSRDEALFLWRALHYGDLAALRAKPWIPGERAYAGLKSESGELLAALFCALVLLCDGIGCFVAARAAEREHREIPATGRAGWMSPAMGYAVFVMETGLSLYLSVEVIRQVVSRSRQYPRPDR